jgi:hypothetical protein
MRDLKVRGHLDRIRSRWRFCIRLGSCAPGTLPKGSFTKSIGSPLVCGNDGKVLLHYFLEIFRCRVKRE